MDDFTKMLNELASTLWLIALAAWGGTVKYFTLNKKFNLVSYLVHICTSAFAGLITMYACAANDVSYPLTACITGIAGHMGVAAIASLEKRFFNKDNNNG